MGDDQPEKPSIADPSTRWPRFSLAWALGVFTWICVLLGAYHAWGVDGLLLWWFTAIGISIHCAVRYRMQVEALLIAAASTVAILLVAAPYSAHQHLGFSQANCVNNLKQVSIATMNYESNNRALPEAAQADSNGQPGLSWRVALLPYLSREPLYLSFKQGEAWDGRTNAQFMDVMPQTYRCPDDIPKSTRHTSYVAITGDDTCWPPAAKVREKDIDDGASTTILLTEMHHSGIVWSEPRDLEYDQADWRIEGTPRNSPGSGHGSYVQYLDGSRRKWGRGPINVAMADGAVRTLSPSVDPLVLKQLCNRHDGQPSSVPGR